MKLKKSSYYCLSQATPPLKNWLHSNKLRYLVLAASVFPMLGTQLYATTDNSLNQTTQSAQTNKVTYHGTVIDENGDPLPGVNISLNSATHIVRNKFKILSNNILTSILPCQKIHLT